MISLVVLLLTTVPMLNSPVGQALTEPLRNGITGGKVGEWATFRIDGGPERVHFWRIAVVGEETDKKGRPACWLELDMGQHHAMKAPLLQLRMLVARSVGLNADGVSRVFIAVGTEKPNELTDEAVAHLLVDDHPRAAPPPAQTPIPQLTTFTGKPSQLMTLAGTVTAIPVELRLRSSMVKRVWISQQVPLLHLAKMEIPAIAHTIEVRDFGINAKPQMLLPAAGTAKIKLERYDDLVIEEPRQSP